jgi:hypothetical protein
VARKAIRLATITLKINQYTNDSGVMHIDIDQTATGGIKGNSENLTLDWKECPHFDRVLGKLVGQTRWIKTNAIEEAYQKDGWLHGEEEKTGPAGERHVESYVVSENGWTGDQVWGFSIVEDKRYYTRKVVVKKGDKVQKVRLVYNWHG